MKIRILSLFLVGMLVVPGMTGCQAANAPGQTADMTAGALLGKHTSPALTLEQAQSIALDHAGVTADQVTALHTEYEIEHGAAQYEVEFHYDGWEYDYEIHADTGEILSYNKDTWS